MSQDSLMDPLTLKNVTNRAPSMHVICQQNVTIYSRFYSIFRFIPWKCKQITDKTLSHCVYVNNTVFVLLTQNKM